MSFAVIEARTRYANSSKSLKAAKKTASEMDANKTVLIAEHESHGHSREEAEAIFKHRYDEALALQNYWEKEVRAAFRDMEEIDPRSDNTFSP